MRFVVVRKAAVGFTVGVKGGKAESKDGGGGVLAGLASLEAGSWKHDVGEVEPKFAAWGPGHLLNSTNHKREDAVIT